MKRNTFDNKINLYKTYHFNIVLITGKIKTTIFASLESAIFTLAKISYFLFLPLKYLARKMVLWIIEIMVHTVKINTTGRHNESFFGMSAFAECKNML